MAEEKKKRLTPIIIIVVIVLLLGLIGAGAYFMLVPKTEGATTEGGGGGAAKAPLSTTKNTNLAHIGEIYQLDQFIVNLLTQGGRRYLKTTIALEMSVPELRGELDIKRVLIRDIVIEILSSKSLEEVSTTRGKEKLKEEIAERINEFLLDGGIRNIFFIDFAVQ